MQITFDSQVKVALTASGMSYLFLPRFDERLMRDDVILLLLKLSGVCWEARISSRIVRLSLDEMCSHLRSDRERV